MAYKQAQNRKKHLLKTYNETKNWYGAGVYFDETRGCYRRYSITDGGRGKRLRRISNRKVRKAKNIGSFGNYRKVYDYWWELD